jgi:hypothetical protein
MREPLSIPQAPALAAPRPALVCFEDRPATGVLRLLRAGFRHCFCLVASPGAWLVCDPLKGGLVLELLPDWPIERLVAHYAGTGRHVAVGHAVSDAVPADAMPRPLTCVEVVKRAVGISAWAVVTPWGLFRRLVEDEGWQAHLPAGGGMLDRREF